MPNRESDYEREADKIQNEYDNHARRFHKAVWNILLRHFNGNEEALIDALCAEIADIENKEQEEQT
jgi:hypothetical protein